LKRVTGTLGSMQRRDEHRAPKPQVLGAGSRVCHRAQRIQRPSRSQPENLLLCPSAVKAELLCAGQMRPEAVGVKSVVADVLGNRDRKVHA
jgi:hypothetical protein